MPKIPEDTTVNILKLSQFIVIHKCITSVNEQLFIS